MKKPATFAGMPVVVSEKVPKDVVLVVGPSKDGPKIVASIRL